jgi:hypothetical protein
LLSSKVWAYWIDILTSAFESNAAMALLEYMWPAIERHKKEGLTLGCSHDFCQRHIEDILITTDKELLELLNLCYDDFGTTSDARGAKSILVSEY